MQNVCFLRFFRILHRFRDFDQNDIAKNKSEKFDKCRGSLSQICKKICQKRILYLFPFLTMKMAKNKRQPRAAAESSFSDGWIGVAWREYRMIPDLSSKNGSAWRGYRIKPSKTEGTGCIGAKFRNQILIEKLLTRSIRFTYVLYIPLHLQNLSDFKNSAKIVTNLIRSRRFFTKFHEKHRKTNYDFYWVSAECFFEQQNDPVSRRALQQS